MEKCKHNHYVILRGQAYNTYQSFNSIGVVDLTRLPDPKTIGIQICAECLTPRSTIHLQEQLDQRSIDEGRLYKLDRALDSIKELLK